jgi:DNA transformation protein
MKQQNEFLEHLSEVFHLFGPIRSRRMFGGHGVYHQDLMIGLVADNVLYLKTDAQSMARFAEVGSVPFEYTKNGVVMTMSYASAPAEIFDDPQIARAWAMLAHEAALRARAKVGQRAK